jgi:hypothetical protein
VVNGLVEYMEKLSAVSADIGKTFLNILDFPERFIFFSCSAELLTQGRVLPEDRWYYLTLGADPWCRREASID